MKKDILNRIEEKLAFPLSRWFWHIVVGLGLVALLVGLVTLIYTLIPTGETKVKEMVTPAPVQIQKQDMIDCANGKMPSQVAAQTTGVVNSAPTGDIPLLASLEPLLKQMPESQYNWNPKMDTAFGTREDWDPYQGAYTIYDTVVNEKPGFKAGLVNMIIAQGGNDQKAQQGIVDSLAKLVSMVPNYKEHFLVSAINLGQVVPDSIATTEWTGFLNRLAAFVIQDLKNDGGIFVNNIQNFINHPNEIANGIEFVDEIMFMSKAAMKEGVNLGNSTDLFANYSSLSNNLINAIKQMNDVKELHTADSLYLLMDKSARPDFIKSLPCYYRAYVAKNAARNAEIAQAKLEYEKAKKEAQLADQAKANEKLALRGTMFIVLGIAVLVVAFFSLMLVLLSIQRSMRQMVEMQNIDRHLNS